MKLYIALPAINELEYIGSTIDCIRKQKGCPEFEVFVCVNQPEQSSGTSQQDSAENEIYLNNQRTLEYLRSVKDIPLTVIDRSSKGKGWKGKEGGVGWARKITIDAIVARVIKTKQEKFHAEDAEEIAKDTEIKSRFRLYEGEDIIISLDADTVFGEKYFASIADVFSGNPDAVGLSVPYYHQLTEDDVLNRAILRYEIYMRHYMINLLRIGSPYSFTALGSAIALPVKACRAIGGLTPKKSGEDFYFLQKLCKFGKVMINNDERVEPAARFSDRVFFGTGPALIKGVKGDWQSYPIYDYRLFDNIKNTYSLFRDLFERDTETPVDSFLKDMNEDETAWSLLRKNSKDIRKFVNACHIKFDGLRILQYLKAMQKESNTKDEERLERYINTFYHSSEKELNPVPENFSFADSPLEEIDKIRDFLYGIEEKMRMERNFTGVGL